MTYLVDANVISEPTKPVPLSNVVDWLSANERNLVVDSIILGELCIGVLALPRGSDYFLIKNSLLRALSASAVSHTEA